MGMKKNLSKKQMIAVVLGGIFVFFVICPQNLTCEETTEFEYKINKQFLLSFGNDVYEVIKSPGSWEGQDWLRLTAVLGTGVVLYAFDQKIYDWSEDRRTPSTEDWASIGSFLGNGLFLGGVISALYIGGEIFDKKDLRKTALLSLESWLTAGAFVLGMKAVLGRARPYTGLDANHFQPFTFESGFHSFPSGHAASAFAVAAVIADQTDFILVDVLAYSMSTLTALARVHESKHWPSDVFIGAALGHFIGKKICSLHREKVKKNVQIGFNLNPNAGGVTINISF
jgi:hypothetical protein